MMAQQQIVLQQQQTAAGGFHNAALWVCPCPTAKFVYSKTAKALLCNPGSSAVLTLGEWVVAL